MEWLLPAHTPLYIPENLELRGVASLYPPYSVDGKDLCADIGAEAENYYDVTVGSSIPEASIASVSKLPKLKQLPGSNI